MNSPASESSRKSGPVESRARRPGRGLKIALSLGIIVALLGLGNWIVGALRVEDYQKVIEGLSELQAPPGFGSSPPTDTKKKEEDRRFEVIQERYHFYLIVVQWGQILVFCGMLTVLVTLLAGLRAWSSAGRRSIGPQPFGKS